VSTHFNTVTRHAYHQTTPLRCGDRFLSAASPQQPPGMDGWPRGGRMQGMDETKAKTRWFQIHLSTLILLCLEPVLYCGSTLEAAHNFKDECRRQIRFLQFGSTMDSKMFVHPQAPSAN